MERDDVEIARALAAEPRFILLDEPFAGVDPISVIDIKRIIEHLRDRGLGVLITDHNVRETLDVCESLYRQPWSTDCRRYYRSFAQCTSETGLPGRRIHPLAIDAETDYSQVQHKDKPTSMKPTLQLRLGQSLAMTPQLQQAIRLLQLSTLELQQEIQQALDANPARAGGE